MVHRKEIHVRDSSVLNSEESKKLQGGAAKYRTTRLTSEYRQGRVKGKLLKE